jgi:hypothetical protein
VHVCSRGRLNIKLEIRAALFTPAVHRLSNVYDERRPTYDGVGAAVTKITREVRALARWGVEPLLRALARAEGREALDSGCDDAGWG